MATKIFAQRYNVIQGIIQEILGNPTNDDPNTGYGQTVKSTQVSVGTSKVRASDYTNIADDMARARYHQVGSAFTGIDPVIPTGVNRAKVAEEYITDLESLITLIQNDKNLVDTSQTSLELLRTSGGATVSSSRTTTWDTSISYSFNVTFSSLTAYRSFFNTGGEIRFSTASDYTGSELKSTNWKALLDLIGTVRFRRTNTTTSSGSISSTTGGQNISSGQTVTLINYNSGSAVYAKHEIIITVERTSNTNLRFTITLNDGPENVDETVKGTITTQVNILRANGALSKVVIPAPVGSNVSTY